VCRLAWWAGCIPSRGLHAPLGCGSSVGAAASAGRRRWQNVAHRRCGSIRVPASGPRSGTPSNLNSLESPMASCTAMEWRLGHPWTPCYSMKVTNCGLWAVEQPSRLTCSATDRSGLPARKALSPPCQDPQPVTGCAHVVQMWALLSGTPACSFAPWGLGCRGRFRD
jgi:hypothetical protein